MMKWDFKKWLEYNTVGEVDTINNSDFSEDPNKNPRSKFVCKMKEKNKNGVFSNVSRKIK